MRYRRIEEAYPHLLAVQGGKDFIPRILAPPWGSGLGVGTDAKKMEKIKDSKEGGRFDYLVVD